MAKLPELETWPANTSKSRMNRANVYNASTPPSFDRQLQTLTLGYILALSTLHAHARRNISFRAGPDRKHGHPAFLHRRTSYPRVLLPL
jgi:hypothetical protein